jgi:xanthine dehydrogenase molybdenum-binding subunit
VVRSTIANGVVLFVDTAEAEKISGIVAIFTCFDVPDIQYQTPGHPWSLDEAHRDVADRKLLNTRVRQYGDDIAVVVAVDMLAATKAAALIRVEYEEYPPITTREQAVGAKTGPPLHSEFPDNILGHTVVQWGEPYAETAARPEAITLKKSYSTQLISHCHLEVAVCHAWMESGRIVVVSSTQIPHILRHVIHLATAIPIGMIRVIKPYIGGGFGNKQEVLYEPLCAWLSMQLGGRCVKLELSREETMSNTRTRHGISFEIETAMDKDGHMLGRRINGWSNTGGYASHGHVILICAILEFNMLYQDEKSYLCDATTFYSNIPCGGAFRGYGVPQAAFAMESHMDDVALALGIDPVELRRLSCTKPGFKRPELGINCSSNGILECFDQGKAHIGWDDKRIKYANQTGNLRRGVGMAAFCYKTSLYPVTLEASSCRIVLNQDGSVQMHMGATELGQGADTVFAQMASETIGIPLADVHIVSTQDTDVTPFDTAAYASRQTYVGGLAVKQTAQIFKRKVLEYAAEMLGRVPDDLDLRDAWIVAAKDGTPLQDLAAVAMESFYSPQHSLHITAESTHHCKTETYSYGACFAEIEVDIALGRVEVLDIINLHDSGATINPQLAAGQVHGGMSMGLGYGLCEQLLYDESAKLLNGNLLDYKMPTALDTPELNVKFVDIFDETAPYGNKSLGEPPIIPVAPALRNALLHATGVAIDTLPLSPQKLVAAFTEAGLIEAKGGRQNV